jgi:hypothetical protein
MLTDDGQRADSGARRLAAWIVALGAVIGLLLLLWLDRVLRSLLAWVMETPASVKPRSQLLLTSIQ